VVTNKKDKKRKGKVQLIDATSLKSTLRKNIGEKNCEITPEIRKQILEFYLAYTDADPLYSKVFDNKEFGYYSVEIQRPLRLRVDFTDEKLETLKESVKDDDLYELVQTFSKTAKDDIAMNFNEFMKQMESAANTAGLKLTAKRKKALRDCLTSIDESAAPVINAKGVPEPDKTLKDTEQIPLLYDGGIEAFWEKEIKPYVPDSWVDMDSVILGYELSITKYFYKPSVVREPQLIVNDINAIEEGTDGLLASIVGGIL